MRNPSAKTETFRRRPAGSERRGLTLVELLMTVLVMGIVAAMLIPQFGSDTPDKLSAVATIIATELENARTLAVANDSNYKLTFDTAGNLFYLQHSGTNTALDTLPPSPFRRFDDPATRQTTVLTELPLPTPAVQLAAVVSAPSAQTASDVEFGPQGNTIRAQETVIWLSCGSGNLARYVSIHVNPATGLVKINPFLTALPTGTGLVTN